MLSSEPVFTVSNPDNSMSPSVRIGIDLVQVSAIERSLADFGARFARRLFADGELADSTVDGHLDARALATRFAAKEATIKAFDLAEVGVGWPQIEVSECDGAAARVRLHGAAAGVACAGVYEIAVALSHDGDLACAIVVALPRAPAGKRSMRRGEEHAAARRQRVRCVMRTITSNENRRHD